MYTENAPGTATQHNVTQHRMKNKPLVPPTQYVVLINIRERETETETETERETERGEMSGVRKRRRQGG